MTPIIWGLSCATNPATYRTIARNADQVWPHWEHPTPPELQQLMKELAEQFRLRAVDPDRPGVYHVGWRTRQNESEDLRWRSCTHPASQLYLRRNPGYTEGHGLLLLVPLTPMGLVRTSLRLVAHAIRRRRRRTAHHRLGVSAMTSARRSFCTRAGDQSSNADTERQHAGEANS
ncbi:MAG: hypothetical protein AAGF11_54570 [Myxococcota bacterium]